MYQRVGAQMAERRSFRITVSLAEGYGKEQKVHPLDDAVQASLAWMKERVGGGLPYLTGIIVPGQIVYAWPDGEGKADGRHEPVAVFQGEVSVLYGADIFDGEAASLLDDLAARLGDSLGQTRVYVSFRDQAWVLQAEGTSTPRGDTV